MLTPQQLDAAYAAFAAFIGDLRLTPQALAIIQQAFLCGYAAGCCSHHAAPLPSSQHPCRRRPPTTRSTRPPTAGSATDPCCLALMGETACGPRPSAQPARIEL